MALESGGSSGTNRPPATGRRSSTTTARPRTTTAEPYQPETQERGGGGRSQNRPSANTPAGLNPYLQTQIENWSRLFPNYVQPVTNNANETGINRVNPWLATSGKYGDFVDAATYARMPNALRFSANMNWSPMPEAQPTGFVGAGYQPRRRYGGGGGGGGYGYAPAPPTPPGVKIRSAPGPRRSPYWESSDPYAQVFEPRFVVLGNVSSWG